MAQDDLNGLFFTTLARFKKLGSGFPGCCDLQLVEWTIMRQAAHSANGPRDACCLNVTELQSQLHVSRSNVSQTLSSLERKGYIVREIDKGDRRKIAVVVTDSGNEKLRQACDAYDRVMKSLMAEFGADNMESLCGMLNLLVDIYDQLEHPPLPE